jgi:hypothetical protein
MARKGERRTTLTYPPMVTGLVAAAEMAEFAASAKIREATTCLQQGRMARATELKLQAAALADIAMAIRDRANQEDTGAYVPLDGDAGPGWSRVPGSRTTLKVPILRNWWGRVSSWFMSRPWHRRKRLPPMPPRDSDPFAEE